ncbi:lipoate--protein ligase family protein [Candidatus Methanoperedens nitratireducens]|uniref:Putative Lipoyltransferase and lipoate-protein ligase n=1 Tax=Candidatus Methanoperedens nitratireducens TaxID=1392998 RepID=A0A284VPY9_9EURY|nr:biotin/lipoate A/B protein ligase family protein [Candidatus Methanoperedens nitroreducens]SNQ61263.1 putative Lipoyltransferase and lipoate-protein ligase [Candidatus Methanoperedens nitroreducens]
MWRFLDLDRIDGFYSAALFESIGKHVGRGSSAETILFWRVRSPVVYLGYHQCVEDEINAGFCSRSSIGIVRRILGGGCGFCNEDQILFSVIGREGGVIPGDIQAAYKKVLGGVVEALARLGAGGEIEPERNAVYSNGRKISGNAQGRFDGAALINGSLLLDFDFELMDKVLKNPTKNLRPVDSAREGMITLKDMGITDIGDIKNSLRQGFERALGIGSRDGTLAKSEIEMADQLLEKYLQNDWIYKMDIKRTLRKKYAAPSPQRSG